MITQINRKSYQINTDLEQFVNNEVLPLTSLDENKFWDDFIKLIDDLRPKNQALLDTRDQLQSQIDEWHQANQESPFDPVAYKQFLQDIGYLNTPVDPFEISTPNVDAEIATIAGPQLVVPLKNARFALNAANARWGSLYDAFYGTDVIANEDALSTGEGYNPVRGKEVIRRAKAFLDEVFPLQRGSHNDVCSYAIYYDHLVANFNDSSSCGLKYSQQYVANNSLHDDPESILLKNNGLHVELVIDRCGVNGKTDSAGVDDILIESAITTIMDCEDSVSAVDAQDKLVVYQHWLGLMQGNLQDTFEKNGEMVTRRLHHDRLFTGREGSAYKLPGRSLLLIRNVGMHMHTELVSVEPGQGESESRSDVPEGIIDAVITSLIGSLDLKSDRTMPNSREGSIYIVKPKLHGPDEVEFTCELFSRVEDMLALPRNTLKIGIMDEERRTSANLYACIERAKERVAFINTGFLDRTGDEIHTSMYAGAFLPKAAIKDQAWFPAYEDNNVDNGLASGFQSRAQIGKGMWPMPDAMAQMLQDKIVHPNAGANTAWVPSPTAATLHALHYHNVSVASVQDELKQRDPASLDVMLSIPLMGKDEHLTETEVERELENNAQGILGYVVHWINGGVGCSKIPDINNVGLMEDRATLRISSQHIANWLHHGICSAEQVDQVLARMARIVDEQNQHDSDYMPMANDLDNSLAFRAARELVFNGAQEANGYTEPTLHKYRKAFKSSQRDVQASYLNKSASAAN